MKVFFMKKYNVFIDFVKIFYLHAIEIISWNIYHDTSIESDTFKSNSKMSTSLKINGHTLHIYYRTTLVCSKSTAVFHAPLSRHQQRINLQSSALQRTTFKYRNTWKLGKWNLRGVKSVLYALFFPLNLYVILRVIYKICNRQLFKKKLFQ